MSAHLTKKLKNNTVGVKKYKGQEIAPGEYYEIQQEEHNTWINDPTIEADITSGDLVVNDGTSDLGATDGLNHYNANDATSIQGVFVDDAAKADGLGLKYDSASGKIIYGAVASPTPDSMPYVTAKHVGSPWPVPATWTDIPLNTTITEIDIAVIQHNDTNNERFDLKSTGEYLVNVASTGDITASSPFQIRVALNGVEIDGTFLDLGTDMHASSHTWTYSVSQPFTAAANDYLTVQTIDTGSTANVKNISVAVMKLEGIKGDAGIQGADGDMTWQGAWVSQNYLTNQSVYYAPTGSSYVCHTNTTASQIPTDVAYWDKLADKGDQGPAGQSTALRLSYAKNAAKSTSGTYETVASFGFDGTTALGTPTAIKALLHIEGATSGSCRVYDATNAQVIAELTGYVDTIPTIKDLGALSNLPANPAVWEIQLLRSGTGSQSNHIDAMSVKF